MKRLLSFASICVLGILLGCCSMNNDSGAIVLTRDLVKQKLLTPTTAYFDNEKVLERKGNLFLVSMTVDAQNVYGARIRKYYLVVLEVLPSGHYYWNPTYAVQELSEPPDQLTINFTKDYNNWDNWQYHSQ